MRAIRPILASLVLGAMAFVPACANRTDNSAPVAPVGRVDLPSLKQAGLQQLWQRHLRLESNESIRNTWRVGTSVYVATSESRLIRLDARSGVQKWSVGLGRENFQIYRPIELSGEMGMPGTQVLVVTRGEAFVFDKETGEETRPPAHLGMSVSANPLVIGNTLCVAGAGSFYGMYLDRLEIRHWVLPAPGDLFMSDPIAVDANVLVASRSGRLWRINASDGDWDWKDRKTNGQVLAGLACDMAAVYVPCMDQRVYAFAADTGGELWESQLEGRLEDAPVLAGDSVLVLAKNNGLYAITRQKGERKWHLPDITTIATVDENTIWVADSAGTLKAIDVNTHEVTASVKVPDLQILVRNDTDQNLVIVNRAGTVGMYSAIK